MTNGSLILACEDGQQIKAHKAILAASSPFFEEILQRDKHPHPLVYLRGFQSMDLWQSLTSSTLVYKENLNFFLVIAEELKLKGLTGQTSDDVIKEKQKSATANPKPIHKLKISFIL